MIKVGRALVGYNQIGGSLAFRWDLVPLRGEGILEVLELTHLRYQNFTCFRQAC